jgi:hypothetical protein
MGRAGTAPPASAPPGSPSPTLTHGQIVLLSGTPHYWVADERGVLHWPADTRALAGRYVRWDGVREVTQAELLRLPRGEPWLSGPGAFVWGQDRTLYAIRWDTGMRWPVPLRLPPLEQLSLFGLTAAVVDAATQDEDSWERLNGLSLEDSAVPFTAIDPVAAPPAGAATAGTARSTSSPTSTPGARVSPAPSGSPSPASAAALLSFGWRAGTYSGTGLQEYPEDTYPVSLTLSRLRPDPQLGVVAGTVSYPSFPCGGPVGLLSITTERIELTERFTSGLERCTDQGRVTIERRSEARVSYTWALPGEGSTARRTVVTAFLFREEP